jgi:DUF4097 and DUF4098 domain-containing protein YvlB
MPRFDTPNPISAHVVVPIGDVRITAEERDDTVVEIRPTDAANADDVSAAQQTRVELESGRLLVKAPKQRSWRLRKDGGSVDVTIALPAGSNANGTGEMTDFECRGRLGDCRIRTGIGSVRVDEAATLNVRTGIGAIGAERVDVHADVTTGSGEVRLSDLGGTGVVKTSNGDTWVGTATGDLRIKAANGSIAVDAARATVAAKSSNGDVRVGEVARDTVVLESNLGDLEVGIPEGTAAWLDVHARAGRVINTLERAGAPAAGAEKVEVRARTSAGNIVIRRP